MHGNKTLFCLVLCIFFITPFFLQAQTAAELETLLESSAITCSEAAWFVLSASQAASGDNSQAAFETAMNNGWLPKKATADDPITLGPLSFLMMKTFGIKGGLLYLIFPGPRYAFRNLVSRSIIQGAADPAMQVSGDRFLQILGNVLNIAGGEE